MAVTHTESKAKERKPAAKKAAPASCALGRLRITLVRSVITQPEPQRQVVRGLGLRKMGSSVVRTDCPEVRGMIRKVEHLVKVEALELK